MASEKLTPEQSSGAQDSLLGRLFELPVVSFTYGVVQKTYTSTKHTHPLICTVCDVYEKGVKTASSIVVWTIQPAIQKLEPQIVAVNHLACKGLDHLEEKIPALQLPPEKLASHIIEVVSSTVQTASDAVFHVMSSSYDQTRGVMEDATDYIFSTRPAKLAAEGVDAALTVTERIVNYVLPGSEEERACVAASATDSQPSSYRRLGTLASTVFRRTYNQTATKLRKARAQGQELVMWIPGISPLTGFAKKNLGVASNALQNAQTSVTEFLQRELKEAAKEKKKKKDGGNMEDLALDLCNPELNNQIGKWEDGWMNGLFHDCMNVKNLFLTNASFLVNYILATGQKASPDKCISSSKPEWVKNVAHICVYSLSKI
ncbi:perilipin-1 isoform X2 [Erpetoichthys calabaricus]|uniref:perilipin-1 isoform X2 n=1 Tax=Erpetoichthys calabaricus TaxID=27687 RepID=UPI00223442D6|nr:perilipin-1 isoform X2 [Erpetoichthys calabaricus]